MSMERRRARQKLLRGIYITALTLTLLILSSVLFDVVRKLRGTEETSSQVPGPTAAPTPSPNISIDRVETPDITLSPAPMLPLLPWPSFAQSDVMPGTQAEIAPLPESRPESRLDAAADYAFYWFTDTQYYSRKFPETFYAMTNWMRENAGKYNVQYAFMTGDLVHNNNDAQWKVATKAMSALEEVMPVFVIAGNHDVGSSNPNYTNFIKNFGPKKYEKNSYIVDWYAGGKGRCDRIEIMGTKYLFIGLGWKSDDTGGVAWLNKTLQQYRDHKAILFFHEYLTTDGQLSEPGQALFDQVVKKNPNVFMVLCGHRYNRVLLEKDIQDMGGGNRTVYNIMMNYQNIPDGGLGYLALIRVFKKDRVITFDTYSPVENKWYYLDITQSAGKEMLTLPVSIFD